MASRSIKLPYVLDEEFHQFGIVTFSCLRQEQFHGILETN